MRRIHSKSWVLAAATITILFILGGQKTASAQYASQCQNGSCSVAPSLAVPLIVSPTVSPFASTPTAYAVATQSQATAAPGRFRFKFFQRYRFVGASFRSFGRRSCSSGGCS